jgi:hypothetical protein
MTSNRNASDLFAGKWLRARDLNQRGRGIWLPNVGGLKVAFDSLTTPVNVEIRN